MIPPIICANVRLSAYEALKLSDLASSKMRHVIDCVNSGGGRMGYLPVHYSIEEFFPKEIIDRYGEMCWSFYDDRMLWTADAIWEHFKYIADAKKLKKYCVLINTWKWGGSTSYRGFRPPEHDETNGLDGAYLSSHKRGSAIDFEIPGISPQMVRDEMINNQTHPDFKFITTIKTYSWGTHADDRNTRENKIIELAG